MLPSCVMRILLLPEGSGAIVSPQSRALKSGSLMDTIWWYRTVQVDPHFGAILLRDFKNAFHIFNFQSFVGPEGDNCRQDVMGLTELKGSEDPVKGM